MWLQPPFLSATMATNIRLGEKVYFNFNCVVLDVCPVRVGDHTFFGPAVQIYAASRTLDAELRKTQNSASL